MPTSSAVAAHATVRAGARRTEEPTRTALRPTPIGMTATTMARALRQAFWKAGVEGRAAIGFDRARCCLAALEGREARPHGDPRSLGVTFCGGERGRLRCDVDAGLGSAGSEEGQGGEDSNERDAMHAVFTFRSWFARGAALSL